MDRQTDRQTDRKTNRQTGRQAGKLFHNRNKSTMYTKHKITLNDWEQPLIADDTAYTFALNLVLEVHRLEVRVVLQADAELTRNWTGVFGLQKPPGPS